MVKVKSNGDDLEEIGLPDLEAPVGVHVTGRPIDVTGMVSL